MTNKRAGRNLHYVAAALGLLLLSLPAPADTIWFRDSKTGEVREVVGNVIGEDQSGTVLLEGLDTQHYYIEKDDRKQWEKNPQPEKLFSKQQLRAHLIKELGGRFHIETRMNYVLAYSCSPKFAEQAGQLLELVHDHFVNFFRNKGGFRFEPLRQPLVAVIYKDRQEYLTNIAKLAGDSLHWSGGVYVQSTNRFYTYEQTLDVPANREEQVNVDAARLSAAQSAVRERNVQMIVHEGVHQLAYNLGFHKRFSYNPKWLAEGMAMYFESGDPDSSMGWNGAGRINEFQLQSFAKAYPRLREGFLHALVVDDDAFMNASTNGEAYAAAWAVNYYLLRSKTRGYVRYLRLIADRPIKPYTADERVEDFRKAFGKTPASIELDFRRFMAPLLSTSLAN